MDFKERYRYNPKTDLLGKGGFARVFRAHDEVLQRYVALKVFSVEVSEKYDLVSEIRKVIGFDQANLCRYYDVAFINGVTTMGEQERLQVGIMEYLDGGDLKSYCHAHPEQQLKLLTDVLKGLSFLHKKGIIHRDLKPANILIKNTEDGPVAKITDFGISKDVGGSHTSSSLLMGTIEYMAPEQFSPGKYGIDGKIGTNLDLWSFGLMVYELVTGESLFGNRGGNSSAEQVMGNILGNDLLEDKISRLPEPYLSVVKRCLVKDAGKRVRYAEELLALLEGKSYSTPSKPAAAETAVLSKPAETVVLQSGPETITIPALTAPLKKKSPKVLITACVLLLTCGSGIAWFVLHKQGDTKLYPVMDKVTAKWGYADKKGKLVIPYQYDWADSMFNGIARVNLNKKFGFADSTGKIKITYQYDYVGRFKGGVARVKQNKKFGFINFSGRQIVPFKYDVAEDFANGSAIVGTTKGFSSSLGLIDTLGREVVALEYVKLMKANNGNFIAAKKDDPAAEHYVTDEVKMGMINRLGEIMIPFKYRMLGPFYNGLALMSMGYDVKQGGYRVGYINASGQEVIPPRYEMAYSFSEGLALVKINGKYGYIDTLGNVVVPAKYDGGYAFSEGIAIVYANNKYLGINAEGKEVLDLKNYSICDLGAQFRQGLLRVSTTNGSCIINKKGLTVALVPNDHFPPIDVAYNGNNMPNFCGFNKEGLAMSYNNDKYGFIDTLGKKIIPDIYDFCPEFEHGLGLVALQGKEGIIDKSGKQLTIFK